MKKKSEQKQPSALDLVESSLRDEAKSNREKLQAQREQWLRDTGIFEIEADAREKLREIERAIAEHGPFFDRVARLDFGAMPTATGVEVGVIRQALGEWHTCRSVPAQLAEGFSRLDNLKSDIHNRPDLDLNDRKRAYIRCATCFAGRNNTADYIRTLRTRIEDQLQVIALNAERHRKLHPNATIKESGAAPVAKQSDKDIVETEFTPG